MLAPRRLLILFLAGSLSIGAASHWLDIYLSGFLPYRFAPLPLNVFWTVLAAADILAAYLLLRHRKSGLVLTLAILVLDVGVNSYATYRLRLFPVLWPLQVQTLILGISLGCIAFLWPRKKASSDVHGSSLQGVPDPSV